MNFLNTIYTMLILKRDFYALKKGLTKVIFEVAFFTVRVIYKRVNVKWSSWECKKYNETINIFVSLTFLYYIGSYRIKS